LVGGISVNFGAVLEEHDVDASERRVRSRCAVALRVVVLVAAEADADILYFVRYLVVDVGKVGAVYYLRVVARRWPGDLCEEIRVQLIGAAVVRPAGLIAEADGVHRVGRGFEVGDGVDSVRSPLMRRRAISSVLVVAILVVPAVGEEDDDLVGAKRAAVVVRVQVAGCQRHGRRDGGVTSGVADAVDCGTHSNRVAAEGPDDAGSPARESDHLNVVGAKAGAGRAAGHPVDERQRGLLRPVQAGVAAGLV
jgi:hypothetical protein